MQPLLAEGTVADAVVGVMIDRNPELWIRLSDVRHIRVNEHRWWSTRTQQVLRVWRQGWPEGWASRHGPVAADLAFYTDPFDDRL